jgi:hypothetical protein
MNAQLALSPGVDQEEAVLLGDDRDALDRAVALLARRAALRRPGHPRRRDLLALARRASDLARPGPVGRVRPILGAATVSATSRQGTPVSGRAALRDVDTLARDAYEAGRRDKGGA